MTLLLITLPMTACGSSIDPVAKAATNSTAQRMVHVDIRGTVTAAGQKVTMNGTGDIHTGSKLGAINFTMRAGGQRIAMDEVQQGTRVYMRSPLFAGSLPRGKKWALINLKDAGAKLGASLQPYTQQDPSDLIIALEQAGSVKKIGSAVVRGADTTHYRATVDLSKTQKSLSAVPIDVWIDDENLLRRVRTHSGGTTFEIDLSRYGENVKVKVPGASETYDMTSLGG